MWFQGLTFLFGKTQVGFRVKLAISLALLVGGEEYRKALQKSVSGMVESIVQDHTQILVLVDQEDAKYITD